MKTEDKQLLKEYLIDNQGKPANKTWREVLELLDIQVTEKSLKAASDTQRYLLKNGSISTGEAVLGITPPQGFKIKSIWGSEEKPLASFVAVDDVPTFDKAEFLADITNYRPDIKSFEYSHDEDKPTIAYEICMPDFHFGRIPVREAITLFKKTIADLVSAVRSGYNIDKFILPVGNDLLNSDSLYYTTTKGTPQFDVDDWQTTFRAAWKSVVECIEWLKTIAPVEVYIVPGNHDYQRAFYIGDVLYAWFRNDDDVTIDNQMREFQAWIYGNAAVMYEHGELKSAEYPLIFATEFPHIFSKAKYKEVHTGHFHKEMINEYRGVKVRFLPSIAPRSKWEKKSGYDHIHQAQGIKWHKEFGNVGIEHVNI